LIGFKSTGLHTNGYSLARKVLFSEYDVNDTPVGFKKTIGEELLQIHKSYLPHISALKSIDGVHGYSHITGGGIVGNTKRILPDGLSLDIDWNSWERPKIFKLIQQTGNVPEDDMRSSFNLGIGLIAVVDPDSLTEIESAAENLGENILQIGTVV